MRKWVCLQLLCMGLMAQPAVAQEVSARGSEAVTLGASSGSATIGYWHKLSDANSIGGDFTLFFRDNNNGDSGSYQFSPGIRHYLQPDKAVSPFLYGALIGTYGKSSNDGDDYKSSSENYGLGVQGGIGLEWFPVQSVSIGGHVGLRAQYEKYRYHSTSPFDSNSDRREGVVAGTFNSGIQVNLYF